MQEPGEVFTLWLEQEFEPEARSPLYLGASSSEISMRTGLWRESTIWSYDFDCMFYSLRMSYLASVKKYMHGESRVSQANLPSIHEVKNFESQDFWTPEISEQVPAARVVFGRTNRAGDR